MNLYRLLFIASHYRAVCDVAATHPAYDNENGFVRVNA